MFDNLGYCIKIEHGVLKKFTRHWLWLNGLKYMSCILLDGSIIICHESLASQDFYDKTKLWHLRLSHFSERDLVELANKGFIGSKKLNKLYFCDHCIF